MRYSLLTLLLALALIEDAAAGKKFRVLFIGNSYTYVNNMPQIIADVAAAQGDTVVWDMYAPGGASFYDHMTDPAAEAKIRAGNWDYVALQEQSQTPALPDVMIQGIFPQSGHLDSLIRAYNSCVETIFYMTWGRKNGDASNCNFFTVQYNWPWYCTYPGMDSLIRLRYRMMADSHQAVLAPAGAIWRYIRANHPTIELYDADGSHPSPAGSYAAACAFYVTLFKTDPTSIKWDYSLGSTAAASIRLAAKKVVYDSMAYWHIGQYRTEAAFSVAQSGSSVAFTNRSMNAVGYLWSFGDGQSATTSGPTHIYTSAGTYRPMLIASGSDGCRDTTFGEVSIVPAGVGIMQGNQSAYNISPNPCRGRFTVDFPAGSADVIVQNSIGHIVFRQWATGNVEVDLGDCLKGLYLVRVTNAGGEWRSRLTVY